MDEKIRNEAWRVMVFVWQAVCAALLPIRLSHIPTAIDGYLEHLARSNKHTRRRQIPTFVDQLDAIDVFG